MEGTKDQISFSDQLIGRGANKETFVISVLNTTYIMGYVRNVLCVDIKEERNEKATLRDTTMHQMATRPVIIDRNDLPANA